MMKKRKQAAALTYDQYSLDAPRVSALGKGKIAENIIEKAKEHNVPIVEDPTLVELLSELNINETIPEELYEAVAEVFAFIYRLDQQQKSS
jgi:flagellar biosynthesis protein